MPPRGQVYVHGDAIKPPVGVSLRTTAQIVRMVTKRIQGPAADVDIEGLADADAPEIRVLAHLTQPGPFAERTHQLGRLVGARRKGQLVAMTGERLSAGP